MASRVKNTLRGRVNISEVGDVIPPERIGKNLLGVPLLNASPIFTVEFSFILTQLPAAIATNAEWSWPNSSRPPWPQLDLTNSSWEENCTLFRMKTPDHLKLDARTRGQLGGDSSHQTDNAVSSSICKISRWPRNQSSRILTSQLTTNEFFFTTTSSSLLTCSSSFLLLQGLEKFQHSEGTGFETWDLESFKLVVGERSGEMVSESPTNLIKRPSVNPLLPVIYN